MDVSPPLLPAGAEGEGPEGPPTLHVLCEGTNDAAVIRRIGALRPGNPEELPRLIPRPVGGIQSLIRAVRTRGAALLRRPSDRLLVLYDEADDPGVPARLAPILRALAGEGGAAAPLRALALPATRSLEAWLLADPEAIRAASGLACDPPIPTDRIEAPKRLLRHHFDRAVRERRRRPLYGETAFIRAALLRFDPLRAAVNNRSLAAFLEAVR